MSRSCGISSTPSEARTYRTPGRVNIIGEHIDYLGGTVLPFACDREVRVSGKATIDGVELISEEGDPAPYAAAVVRALGETGGRPSGFRGWVTSTLPTGAGLSSSAALAAAIALAVTGGGEVEPAVLQRAEQLATGVPCGVMDQTAILRGRAGHAMLIDCASGAVDHVPIPPAVGFVVVDTGTRRDLADGRYALRRSEVESGHPERVRHAGNEQRRVHEAVAALRAGDAVTLGALVSQSHASLRDDFEVSAPALDAAAEAAERHPSCYGARLVGAGFAGCVLAVVAGGAEDAVARYVEEQLPTTTAWGTRAADGAGEIGGVRRV